MTFSVLSAWSQWARRASTGSVAAGNTFMLPALPSECKCKVHTVLHRGLDRNPSPSRRALRQGFSSRCSPAAPRSALATKVPPPHSRRCVTRRRIARLFPRARLLRQHQRVDGSQFPAASGKPSLGVLADILKVDFEQTTGRTRRAGEAPRRTPLPDVRLRKKFSIPSRNSSS
jgi:hypothetical protein